MNSVGSAATAKIPAVISMVPGTYSSAWPPRPRVHITYARHTARVANPPRYPKLQPQPDTLPSACGRDLRQECANQRHTDLEEEVRNDDGDHGDRDIALPCERQRSSRSHTADRRQPQQPLLARMQIRIGPDNWHRDHHDRFDTHSVASHTRDPQSAPSATTLTKYALNTAVRTTVV